MSAVMTVEEAVGPDMDLVDLDVYLFLLSLDEHSNQNPNGFEDAVLRGSNPRSYERWVRMRFDSSFGRVGLFRFWAQSLFVPPGWALKFGSTPTYATPTDAVSSIATTNVPITPPATANCGGMPSFEPGTGTEYSEWIVIQAVITDFSLVNPGPMIASTGTEFVTPTFIAFDFSWYES